MAIIVGTGGVQFSDSTVQTTKFDSTMDSGDLLNITSYTTAGTFTWTKPTGANRVLVKVVGGGGGGAGYCESGGAGGYSEKKIDVSAVSTVTVTVGGGGAGVTYWAVASTGGTSSFGTYCTATGGYGSSYNSQHSGGIGGVGSGGDVNLYGGAGTGHANSSGHYVGGVGGTSHFGGSSTVSRPSVNVRTDDSAWGSGGPGARTNDGNIGNAGMNGAVVVYAYK